MKLVLVGSLGHVGRPLAELLVHKKHEVTVITSKEERRAEIEALGAAAAVGSADDAAFLTAAFRGADAVYTMIPPTGAYTDPDLDVDRQVRALGEAFAAAIAGSGVGRVVHMSSIGADLERGAGLLRLHHAMEQALNPLRAAITFLRPTGFYYNLLSYIPMIKARGSIAANYGEDDVVSWVAPSDIAEAAAEELETLLAAARPGARKVRYVASEEISCRETARLLGEAIGKPDLPWIVIPGDQMKQGLIAAGLKPAIADGMVEMYAASRSGLIYQEYFRNRPALGRVKVKDFAREFAAAYHRA